MLPLVAMISLRDSGTGRPFLHTLLSDGPQDRHTTSRHHPAVVVLLLPLRSWRRYGAT